MQEDEKSAGKLCMKLAKPPTDAHRSALAKLFPTSSPAFQGPSSSRLIALFPPQHTFKHNTLISFLDLILIVCLLTI